MEAQYNVVAFGRHHFLPDNIPRNPLGDFSRIIGSIHRIQYIISLAIMAIYEFMPLLNNNSWPVVIQWVPVCWIEEDIKSSTRQNNPLGAFGDDDKRMIIVL